MLLCHLTIVFATIKLVVAQIPTPCPEIFSYEPRDDNSDRWYGQLKYSGDKNFTGVWLHIALDRPVDILGNWFGHVSTCDNTVFVIRRLDYTLQAGYPFSLRFFVKFDLSKTVPSVETIKFNGNVVCANQNRRNRNPPVLFDSDNVENQDVKHNKSSLVSPGPTVTDSGSSLTNSHQDTIDVRSVQCGVIASFATPLISHGQETFPGQWPWHGALYHFEGVQISYECGSTLITVQHVVTAAHCVTLLHTKIAMKPRNILISLGKYNLNTFEEGLQNIGVSNIYVHPNYDSLRLYNDIAVLKLSNPVEITNYVRPCCLWDKDSDLNQIVGSNGIVVGWGDNGTISYKLKQAAMPVISREECFLSKREYREFLSSNNYCAGNRNGTTACRGDSGSAMVFPKRETNGETVWQIRGIVSLSLIPKIQGTCEMSNYNIFTDVAKFTDWIQEVIQN